MYSMIEYPSWRPECYPSPALLPVMLITSFAKREYRHVQDAHTTFCKQGICEACLKKIQLYARYHLPVYDMATNNIIEIVLEDVGEKMRLHSIINILDQIEKSPLLLLWHDLNLVEVVESGYARATSHIQVPIFKAPTDGDWVDLNILEF